MTPAGPDRELLYAIFAQHLGYVTAADVLGVGAEWATRRAEGASLRALLRERQLLAEPQAALLDALVDEAVAQSQGDVAKTLQSLPPRVRQGLVSLSATLDSGPQRTGAAVFSGEAPVDSLETADNVGSEAHGRYTFDTGPRGATEELGKGGTGRVRVARDAVLGREVAMKELLRELTTSTAWDTAATDVLEARFLREARVTGQLDHPAVVPVYELARRADGTLYYTMQRVRGRTLSQAIADCRTLSARLALVPDLVTVCRALASAHHQGVIHRDLKPQNVMLGAFGETYLMDWGLARVLGRKDAAARPVHLAPDLTGGRPIGAVGTPSYMSPEQAAGSVDDIDERSDVYGLGAVLYEVLTGRAPYVGDSPWDVIAAVRTERVTPVLSLCPDAPPELAAVCEKALARHQEDRYASAAELADELTVWLEGGRVKAYDYPVLEVARRLYRRHKALAAIAALALLAFVVAFTVSAWRVGVERDEAQAFARVFLDEVSQRLEALPGTADLVDQLMTSSLEVYRQGVDLERGPVEDRLRLARAWTRLGNLNWSLGRAEQARGALALARSVAEGLVAQRPDDGEALAALVRARLGLTDLVVDQGELAQALPELLALAGLADRAAELGPLTEEVHTTQALAWSRLAALQLNLGELEAARRSTTRNVGLLERWAEQAPESREAMGRLSYELGTLGEVESRQGELAGARTHLARSLELARELVRLDGSNRSRELLVAALYLLARFEYERGDSEAPVALAETRAVLEQRLRAEPDKAVERVELAETLLMLDEGEAAFPQAQSVAQLGEAGEYAEALIGAAFATGRDALLDEKVANAAGVTRAPALLYGALSAALRGELKRASALAEEASRHDELRAALWLPGAVERRAKGLEGPGPRAVRRVVERTRGLTEDRALQRAMAGMAQELAKEGAP